MSLETLRNQSEQADKDPLTAKIEPFDSFWEGPEDIEKGYDSFGKFYKANYLPYVPSNRSSGILVISCGPGYFVNMLKEEGYQNVIGIDSYQEKVQFGPALPDFVLAPFASDEGPVVQELIVRAADACGCWVDLGVEAAMNRFNC